MISESGIDNYIKRLLANMPDEFSRIHLDLEKNLKAALRASFSRMELVTREEYDIQTALLQRTREKLVELETKLAELEKQLQDNKTS
jgi:ubiquinone biosynthesis accessory factor UbiK